MPWYDTQGKIQTFNPGQQSTVFPLSPTGLVFPGDAGIPKTLAHTTYNNFGPRLGLAYSPGFSDGLLGKIFGGPGKSSIRAAYGLYYTSVEDLNLFYEVADAPFGLYWTSPVSVMFDQPFLIRATGQSLGQRFPFTAPIPGAPSNKTLDFSVYEPFNYFPGYDIHNKLPYAEHFNLSIQRELTQINRAHAGLRRDRGPPPHHAARSEPRQRRSVHATERSRSVSTRPQATSAADLAMRTTSSSVRPAPFRVGRHLVRRLSPTPHLGCVYSTRQQILNPNFCPGGAQVCFGSNNTNTLTTANSIYNSGQISIGAQGQRFHVPGGVYLCQRPGRFFGLQRPGEFPESQVEPRAVIERHYSQLRGQLHLGHPVRPGFSARPPSV